MTLTIIAVQANQGFALLGKNENGEKERERERARVSECGKEKTRKALG